MICTPIRKKDINTVIKNIKEAQKIADLIEIWFEEIQKLNEKNLKRIFAIKKKPFLYKSFSNIERIFEILKYKVEFIDLDISTSAKTIKEIKKNYPKTQIIMSFHDFKKTPNKKSLKKIIINMKKKGADIVKIATKANNVKDCFIVLELLGELKSKSIKAICICMGKEGGLTRIIGHLLGNYIIYAPLNLKDKTADGQITASQLKRILNLTK